MYQQWMQVPPPAPPQYPHHGQPIFTCKEFIMHLKGVPMTQAALDVMFNLQPPSAVLPMGRAYYQTP